MKASTVSPSGQIAAPLKSLQSAAKQSAAKQSDAKKANQDPWKAVMSTMNRAKRWKQGTVSAPYGAETATLANQCVAFRPTARRCDPDAEGVLRDEAPKACWCMENLARPELEAHMGHRGDDVFRILCD